MINLLRLFLVAVCLVVCFSNARGASIAEADEPVAAVQAAEENEVGGNEVVAEEKAEPEVIKEAGEGNEVEAAVEKEAEPATLEEAIEEIEEEAAVEAEAEPATLEEVVEEIEEEVAAEEEEEEEVAAEEEEEKAEANVEAEASDDEAVVTEEAKSMSFVEAQAADDFDAAAFEGVWYHIYRLKWSHHKYESEVNSIELKSDGSLLAKSTYYDGTECSEVKTATYTQIKNQTGHWTYDQYGGVKVLYSDDSYTVLLICDHVQNEGTCNSEHMEVEVMARSTDTTAITDDVKAKLIKVAEALGLTADDFDFIDNTVAEQCELEKLEKTVKCCMVEHYKSQDDLDYQQFSGVWHELERTRYSKYDKWQSGHFYFSVDEEFLQMQYVGSSSGECRGPYKGYGKSYVEKAGDMLMFVGDRNAHGSPFNVHYTYKVLFTDYTTYAVTYSCISKKDDGTCHQKGEQITVLSRSTEELDEETKSMIYEKAADILCFNVEDLKKTVMEKHCDELFPAEAVMVEASGEASGEGSGEGSGSGEPELLVEGNDKPVLMTMDVIPAAVVEVIDEEE